MMSKKSAVLKRPPKYLKRYTDCTGRERVYYRRGAFTSPLPSLSSPRFEMEYKAAEELAAKAIVFDDVAARRRAYVYAIAGGDKIKIGVATRPDARLESMQTGSPERLEIIALKECANRSEAISLERNLHQRFKPNLVFGEWFKIAREVAEQALA